MKKTLLILIFFSFIFQLYSQENKNERIKEIKELYKEVNNNKNDNHMYFFSTPYEEGIVWEDTLYYDKSGLRLIKISDGGEFSGGFTEIYFKEGEIFFIYTRRLNEGHWMNPPIHFTLTESRFYFDKNENIVMILKKKKEGHDIGNIDKASSNTPNVEVEIDHSYEYKDFLKTGREYRDVFIKLSRIHQ